MKDYLITQDILLERIKYQVQGTLNDLEMAAFGSNVEVLVSRTAYNLIIRLVAAIAKQDITLEPFEFIFKYPKNWWQAFKYRFFPTWALKRWPIKYATVKETHKVDVSALYPQLVMPHAIMKFTKLDPERRVTLDD